MLRHLRSLRRMDRDHGWIHTLLEEAENERMHLLTFLKLRRPGPIFRLSVVLTQVKQGWMPLSLNTVESVSVLLAGPGYESLFHIIPRAPAALPSVSFIPIRACTRSDHRSHRPVPHRDEGVGAGLSDTSRRRRSTRIPSSWTPSTKVQQITWPPLCARLHAVTAEYVDVFM